MEIKDKELHRVTTTVIIYTAVPEQSSVHGKSLKYLITKRAMHKKVMPGKWTIPGGGLSTDDYINLPVATLGAPQWYGALEWGLAKKLAPKYGKGWTDTMEQNYTEAMASASAVDPETVPQYFQPNRDDYGANFAGSR